MRSSFSAANSHLRDSNRNLSTNAAASLKDFKTQLSFLRKDVLDEEAFNVLLDNIGYKRSREGLFQSLLAQVTPVVEGDEKKKDSHNGQRYITVADMTKLYFSEEYHLLDNGKDSGDSLMEYVDNSEYLAGAVNTALTAISCYCSSNRNDIFCISPFHFQFFTTLTIMATTCLRRINSVSSFMRLWAAALVTMRQTKHLATSKMIRAEASLFLSSKRAS